MGFLGLLQTLFNLIFLAGLVYLWIRAHRAPQDDPRLSRGLQLLQSKISVLEDLSDRVEQQTEHFSSIVQQKLKELQEQIANSDQQVQIIETSMRRSLDVAKIFQDKIPHGEIIERQNTIKYIKAAKMAHRGASIEEIAKVVDLPVGEISFIAKVNRDGLQFEESELPDWARDAAESLPADAVAPRVPDSQNIAVAKPNGLSDLGERFRNAIPEGIAQELSARPGSPNAVKKFEFPDIKPSTRNP